jgi:hypothetical protein
MALVRERDRAIAGVPVRAAVVIVVDMASCSPYDSTARVIAPPAAFERPFYRR